MQRLSAQAETICSTVFAESFQLFARRSYLARVALTEQPMRAGADEDSQHGQYKD